MRAGCSKADPQTNKHTNRQWRLQYTAQLSAQCNNAKHVKDYILHRATMAKRQKVT